MFRNALILLVGMFALNSHAEQNINLPLSNKLIEVFEVSTKVSKQFTFEVSSTSSFFIDVHSEVESVNLSIEDPQGSIIPSSNINNLTILPGQVPPLGAFLFGVGVHQQIKIDNPIAGTWTVDVSVPKKTKGTVAGRMTVVKSSSLKVGATTTRHTYNSGDSAIIAVAGFDSASPAMGAIVSANIYQTVDDPSPQTITLLDDGLMPDAQMDDGLYTGHIDGLPVGNYLVETVFQYNNESIESGAEFNIAPLLGEITGNVTDAGTDTNTDGLLENIDIAIEVDIKHPGNYDLVVELKLGENILFKGVRADFPLGLSTQVVSFPADDIKQLLKENGPYLINDVKLIINSSPDGTQRTRLADQRGDLGSTQAYQLTQLQRPLTIIADGFTETPVDINGNNKIDTLGIGFQVDVLEPGEYRWSANLKGLDGTTLATSSNSANLINTGLNSVSLNFNGSAIGSSGANGPYKVVAFGIYGPPNTAAIKLNMGQTVDYYASQFEGYISPLSNLSVGDGTIVYGLSELTITGTINDPSLQLTVNGEPAVITDTIFSVTVPLIEGDNILEFVTISLDSINNVVNTITVIVPSLPIANASIDQSVPENSSVSLDGSASSDYFIDGIVTYAWTQVSGQSVSISNANTAFPTFIAPSTVFNPLTLTFELTVTNKYGITATDQVSVIVNISDVDNDGLSDSWEILYFGDLLVDGLADTDGDGFTNLEEFNLGSDPKVAAPLDNISGINVLAGNASNRISWLPVERVLSYDIYWSNTPGVTTASQNSILGVSSPYDHVSLVNGDTYYYIIVARNNCCESISNEVSGAPSAVPPVLTITSHVEGAIVNQTHIVIFGSTDRPVSEVKVNGNLAQLTSDTTFYYGINNELNLVDGLNLLTIEAMGVDNITATPLSLSLNRQSLVVNTDNNGITNGAFQVNLPESFTSIITDYAIIDPPFQEGAGNVFTIPFEGRIGKTGFLTNISSTTLEIPFELEAINQPQGIYEKNITVSLKDSSGNDVYTLTTPLSIVVPEYTSGPDVTVTYPPDGYVSRFSKLHVSGNIGTAVEVSVNGIIATISGDTFILSEHQLEIGNNAIIIQAKGVDYFNGDLTDITKKVINVEVVEKNFTILAGGEYKYKYRTPDYGFSTNGSSFGMVGSSPINLYCNAVNNACTDAGMTYLSGDNLEIWYNLRASSSSMSGIYDDEIFHSAYHLPIRAKVLRSTTALPVSTPYYPLADSIVYSNQTPVTVLVENDTAATVVINGITATQRHFDKQLYTSDVSMSEGNNIVTVDVTGTNSISAAAYQYNLTLNSSPPPIVTITSHSDGETLTSNLATIIANIENPSDTLTLFVNNDNISSPIINGNTATWSGAAINEEINSVKIMDKNYSSPVAEITLNFNPPPKPIINITSHYNLQTVMKTITLTGTVDDPNADFIIIEKSQSGASPINVTLTPKDGKGEFSINLSMPETGGSVVCDLNTIGATGLEYTRELILSSVQESINPGQAFVAGRSIIEMTSQQNRKAVSLDAKISYLSPSTPTVTVVINNLDTVSAAPNWIVDYSISTTTSTPLGKYQGRAYFGVIDKFGNPIAANSGLHYFLVQ